MCVYICRYICQFITEEKANKFTPQVSLRHHISPSCTPKSIWILTGHRNMQWLILWHSMKHWWPAGFDPEPLGMTTYANTTPGRNQIQALKQQSPSREKWVLCPSLMWLCGYSVGVPQSENLREKVVELLLGNKPNTTVTQTQPLRVHSSGRLCLRIYSSHQVWVWHSLSSSNILKMPVPTCTVWYKLLPFLSTMH